MEDLTGRKFTNLTAISRIGNYKRWLCKCDCGNNVIALERNLLKGRQKSCGCLDGNLDRTTHGLSYTRLHKIWDGMKYRCNNPTSKMYPHYGGRGINICPEWNNSFMAFYDWATNNGYAEDLSIDRIDVNGDYEPSNCRWVNHTIQMNNTTTTLRYSFNGKEMSLSDIAREIGMDRATLYARVRIHGYSIEDAASFPVGGIPHEKSNNSHYKKITWNGKTLILKQWADELGMNPSTLRNRIFRRHWSIDKAFTEPVRAREAV